MSKATYEDLVNLLSRIQEQSDIESPLGLEFANYPIELYDEILDTLQEVGSE
jgi:hypothetical protein